MSKFKKRISKVSSKSLQNALVVGEGFGFLRDITEMFDTVFIVNQSRPMFKARNLVYKENYDDLNLLVDVSHVFFDLSKLNDINLVSQVFLRWKSLVIIQGNDLPNKEMTQPLLNAGYKCYRLDGIFHPWELK